VRLERYTHVLSKKLKISDKYRKLEIVGDLPPNLTILDYPAANIASQMTYLDHRMFALIPITEFIKKRFQSPELSPRLTKMTESFNKITGWIGNVITGCPNIKLRRKIISHLISVGIQLYRLHNFAGLMAVFVGITQFPVSRMTRTWDGLSFDDLDKWEKLSNLCTPLANFKNLRYTHEFCDPPSVKTPAIFLKDLTYIEESSSTIEENNRVYWNLQKIQQLGKLIENIHAAQNISYQITPIPHLLELLSTIPKIETETLENLSYKNEPVKAPDE